MAIDKNEFQTDKTKDEKYMILNPYTNELVAHTWDDSRRIEAYEGHLESFLREVKRKDNIRFQEYKVRAYKGYYEEAGKKNYAKFQKEMDKYDSLMNSLEDLSEYPSLNKMLKIYRTHLFFLIKFGKSKLLENKKLAYKGKEKYTFSLSTRFFSDYLKENEISLNHSKVAKLFNLFSLLGFTEKAFDDANGLYTKIRKEDVYNITYFSINDIDLSKAEEMATKLYDNKYKFNQFTKSYVEDTFGQEVANKIYEKPETKTHKTETVEVISLDNDIPVEAHIMASNIEEIKKIETISSNKGNTKLIVRVGDKLHDLGKINLESAEFNKLKKLHVIHVFYQDDVIF